mmetsp:Transcript_6538/g.25288  ORF Transcript_6538/g.25288 Transcript_6538/m.25288 type:complete len:167 (-) Transcript_6538:59-559(-)
MLLRRAWAPTLKRTRLAATFAAHSQWSPATFASRRFESTTSRELVASVDSADAASSSVAGGLLAIDEEQVAAQAVAEVTAPKFPKGTRVGIVTSAGKMRKTIAVQYHKRKYIPKYDVYYNKKVKVFAHDEDELANEGDKVRVIPGDKRTERKRHVLESIIKRNAKV